MQVELSREAVGFGLLGKVSKLSKVTVDHDNFGVQVAFAVGNEDSSVLWIGWIVLLIEPYSSLLTYTDVFLCI